MINLGLPEAGRRGRPALAAFLSTVLPGAGQWYAGRRRRSLLLLAVAGAGLGATIWFAARGAVYLLRTFVQPRWLWALLAVNLVVLAVRVFAVADAYALERRLYPGAQPGRGWPARAFLVLLLAAVVVPHAVLFDYGLEAIDTIEALTVSGELPPLEEREQALLDQGFTEGDLGPTTTTAPPTTTTIPLITPSTLPPNASQWAKERWLPEDDLHPVRPVIVPAEPAFYNAPFVPLHERLDRDRLTILLAGGDAGPGRWSLRTDVMIVATINLDTGKAVLFSISRDMVYAPLPEDWDDAFLQEEYEEAVAAAEKEGVEPPAWEGFKELSCKCFPDRMNAIWTYTQAWVRTFPEAVDPGMEALRQALSLLLGLRIDYYVLVDMAGFVDLVDALGGLDIYITETMDVGFSPAREGEDPVRVTIAEPGTYHLDGHQALAFVRNRTGTSDSYRMQRQRCTLRALAAQIDAVTVALRFPQIARAVRESAISNIPLSFLPDLVEYATTLDLNDIATVAFGYPYYAHDLNFRNLPIVDPERIRLKVRSALEAVETVAGTADLTEECNVLPAR
ncbi:MAG: LCP family protein [Acidimicrobiia bacterium]|nr:LCP family protein [Acidimicrobiia bacterium]